MHARAVIRVLGLLLLIYSASMLPPLGVSLYYGDGGPEPFLFGLLVLAGTGLLLWLPNRRARAELRIRDGFLVVALFWFVLGMASAVPLLVTKVPVMSVTDAVFEAISGLTTTGATVLSGLDTMPHSVLYYRQQLQWLGGGGIIVLAVAVLPMLGVGGMQLYRAEVTGSLKENRLAPRIAQTAKALWVVYLTLTVSCALAYWLAGMSLFDAIGHSFSTVSTGGFSTHDASMAWFESDAIELIATLFMIAGGINFALHFAAFRGAGAGVYWRDAEARTFLKLLLIVVAGVALLLFQLEAYGSVWEAFLKAAFNIVSVTTSTGFTTADFSLWPSILPVLIILGSFVGGCGGSTAGGMKVMRFYLLYRQGVREIRYLIHPAAQLPVKLGDRPVSREVIDAVWGFFAAYVVLSGSIMLAFMACGLDQVSAFGAVAATINNLGPGLGEVAVTFATASVPAKWVAVFAMLLGRLEIFTVFVLLTPAFWRR